MPSTDETAAKLAEWQKVIDEIRKKVSQTDDQFRALGIDPEAVRARTGPKEEAEAERLFAQDMADVEREVARVKAEKEAAAAKPRSSRRFGRTI
jgi:hypothetical protein